MLSDHSNEIQIVVTFLELSKVAGVNLAYMTLLDNNGREGSQDYLPELQCSPKHPDFHQPDPILSWNVNLRSTWLS